MGRANTVQGANRRESAATSARATIWVLASIAVVTALWIWLVLGSPRVFLLVPHAGATWIRHDQPFDLAARTSAEEIVLFRKRFRVDRAPERAPLEMIGFKAPSVVLDGVRLSNPDLAWDRGRERVVVELAADSSAGPHELIVGVANVNAHPALWARCAELSLATDETWETSVDGSTWSPAVGVDRVPRVPQAAFVPSAASGFVTVLPWLALVAAATIAWSFARARGTPGIPRITPGRLAATLVAALLVLGSVDLVRVPQDFGMDLDGHLAYVQYVATRHSIPLANEGWQMFQPPLAYLIYAPIYAGFRPHVPGETMIWLLRTVPLACQLLQIEVARRALRAALPGREELQCVGLWVAALFPMGMYIARAVGNEPVAGLTGAIVVWRCVELVVRRTGRPGWRELVVLGACLGLALLSKATALLLVPVAVACVVHAASGTRDRLLSSLLVLGSAFAIAGWFYVRNWIELGQPLIGGWDALTGTSWWQDPSYRTPGDFLRFGGSLAEPAWANVRGFWDALYASLCTDSTFSGHISAAPPWNASWMVAGAWLFVPIVILMIVGALRRGDPGVRGVRALCCGAIGLYVGFLLHLFATVPMHCVVKATYTLGILPCYALLAALGCAPLMAKAAWRGPTLVALACFGVASYCAYFVL